jgi:hypothetical protein
VRARKLELFGGRQNLAKSLDIALQRARQILGVPTPGTDVATMSSRAKERRCAPLMRG